MFLDSKRKNYLINPKFQISFILFSTVTSLIGMSVFFIAIKYFFWSFKKMGEQSDFPANHVFFRFIDDQNAKMNLIFLISSTIVLIISIIGAVMMSHRVAGPVYRLTSHLKKSTEKNDLAEVKFRTGDFFMELQDAYNDFVKKNKK